MPVERMLSLSRDDILNRVEIENNRHLISTGVVALGVIAAPFLVLHTTKDIIPLNPETEKILFRLMADLSILVFGSHFLQSANHLRGVRKRLNISAKETYVKVNNKLGGLLGLNAEIDYSLLHD